MNINKSLFRWVNLIGLCILLAASMASFALETPVPSSQSNFNLTKIDFSDAAPKALEGIWELYPSMRIMPEDFTGRASRLEKKSIHVPNDLYRPDQFQERFHADYGTIRTKVTIDENYVGKPMALRSTLFYKHATVFIDGIAYMTDDDDTSFYDLQSALNPQIIANFIPKTQTFDIVIHFSLKDNLSKNFGNIMLGQADQVYSSFIRQLMLDIIIFSALITLTIFNLAFYFRKNRRINKDKVGLYFALLIALMSIRILNLGEHYILYLLPQIPGEIFAKLGYWSYYLTVPMLVVFVTEVKNDIFPRYIQRSAIFASMVFGLFVLMVDYNIYSKLIWLYYGYSLAAFFYVGLFFYKATVRYKSTAWKDIIGLLVALATFLADSFYINGVTSFQYFYIIGAFAFIVYNTILLSLAYSNAVDVMEDLFVENNGISEKLYLLENSLEESIQSHTSALTQQLEQKTVRLNASEKIIAQMEGAVLLFDGHLRIEAVYGRDVERLLGNDLIGKKITKVLFHNQMFESQLFEDILLQVGKMSQDSRMETYLSLIPKETSLNGKTLNFRIHRVKEFDGKDSHYSVWIDELSDSVYYRRQFETVENQVHLLESFIRFKDEILYLHRWQHYFFEQELKQIMEKCKTRDELVDRVVSILDRLALWHQAFGFRRTSENLKQFVVEFSRLYQMVNQISFSELCTVLEDAQLKRADEEDIRALKDLLGYRAIEMNKTHQEIEQTQKGWDECLEVLKPYIEVVADRFGKVLMPIEITGDTFMVSVWKTGSFMRNLARVFDAMLYHSIEFYDERIKSGKSINARINIHSALEGDFVKLTIDDDGSGFQAHVLKDNLFKMNVLTFKEMIEITDAEIQQYLFTPGIQYKEIDKGWTLIGNELWKVKEAVSALHGRIYIDPEYRQGARFVVELPIKELI